MNLKLEVFLFISFTFFVPISSFIFSPVKWTSFQGHVESRRSVKTPPLINKVLPVKAIKGVDTYDASFTLTEEMEESLLSLLTHDDMINEVKKNAKSAEASFTGLMFQPVPYSSNTPYGMPEQFEKYYHDKENYVVCNIPPFFMFQAKIFKPSRLCAIYQIKGREDFSFSKNRDGSETVSGKAPTIENSDEVKKNQDDAVWKEMGTSLRQLMIDEAHEEDEDSAFDFDKYIL